MSARHRGLRPMTRRERLEAAIEFAVAALDAMDGDPDQEADDEGDEDPVEYSAGPVTLDRYLAEELVA